MNKKKFLRLIIVLILFFIFIKIIIAVTVMNINGKVVFFRNKRLIYMEQNIGISDLFKYNFKDIISAIDMQNYSIKINSTNCCVYESKCKVDVAIENFSADNNYEIKYSVNDFNGQLPITQNSKSFNCELIEGKNKVIIQIYENGKLRRSLEEDIYRIIPYEKQFLDELSKNGVQLHYKHADWEDYNDIPLVQKLGVNYARVGLTWELIEKNTGELDFDYTDKWLTELNNAGINILATIGTDSTKYVGKDRTINTDEEMEHFKTFSNSVINRYKYIENFEIMNEPNYNAHSNFYKNSELVQWYSRTAKSILLENTNRKFTIGSLTAELVSSDHNIAMVDFLAYMGKYKEDFNRYSVHPYDWYNYDSSNIVMYRKLNAMSKYMNSIGGFNFIDITEYGISSYNNQDLNEDAQSNKIVQQSILLDGYNVDLKILYNFWNRGTNVYDIEHNFGLVSNDYKPKKAYYAVKEYYENTNGAEFIGDIKDFGDNVYSYIYDKEGECTLVVWYISKTKTLDIEYGNFKAYDVYGNEIPNENGKLTISSSPVYLKGVDRSYFYKAISNNAVTNYDQFLSDYEKYLNSCDEMIAVKNKVLEMREYAQKLSDGNEISEDEAISKMNEHFNIGNSIISAYTNGSLVCEDVNVSSMLDSLNTIGYAYEDLVTITANDVTKVNLESAKKRIDVFNQKIAQNPDVDIIYPKKINSFAEDYYETSSYINSLEEENPIKNGLIISKGLHAFYLSVWANSFANNYLKESMITVEYSTTELTNGDVTATLISRVPIEMEGSNVYTFTENGSFTFKYLLDGEEKEVAVTVNWIDKESPIITGWEDRIDELEVATINVIDDNIDTIVVTKDGAKIDFNNGDTLFEVGTYEIVATDKLGNSSTVVLRIVDYIESNKTYYISNIGSGDGLSENSPMNISEASKIKYYAGDKILLKSGEKYKINLNWSLMGSPSNKITISNFGDGDRPIIEGSIGLVSNLNISNIQFTNSVESCLVTNQNYCDNVDIDNCIFNSVSDIAIYLNRQVYNFDIRNCIFKDCFNAAIAIKNDTQKLIADNIKIYDNIFVCSKANIIISGKNGEETFSEVEVYDNAFLNQTDENSAIIEVGTVRDTEFDVSLYNNVYYNFARAYMVGVNDIYNLKNNLRSDNNTFYSIDSSKFINDCNDFDLLKSEYKLDNNSGNILMSGFAYQIDLVSKVANDSLDRSEILAYMTQTILKADSNQKVITIDTENSVVLATTGFDQVRTSMIGSASELEDKNSQEKFEDVTVAEENLPLTGWKRLLVIMCVILLVMGTFSGAKYIKYKKDIKKQIKK